MKSLGSKDAAELQKKIETAVPVDITQADLRLKLQLELVRHLKLDLVDYSLDQNPNILGVNETTSAEEGSERKDGLGDLIMTHEVWRKRSSVIHNLAKSLQGTNDDERTEFSVDDFDWRRLGVKLTFSECTKATSI